MRRNPAVGAAGKPASRHQPGCNQPVDVLPGDAEQLRCLRRANLGRFAHDRHGLAIVERRGGRREYADQRRGQRYVALPDAHRHSLK